MYKMYIQISIFWLFIDIKISNKMETKNRNLQALHTCTQRDLHFSHKKRLEAHPIKYATGFGVRKS